MTHYLFVGEKRSPTAQRMNVTWRDGRLCAKNLHEALRACDIDPVRHEFTNLWTDDGYLHPASLIGFRAMAETGKTIVALGQKVDRELTRHQIPHLTLTHPAARGSIRKAERYQAHVREVLGVG